MDLSASKIRVVVVGGRSERFTGDGAETAIGVFPYPAGEKAGEPGGIRTHDPWIKRMFWVRLGRLLCVMLSSQLSYPEAVNTALCWRSCWVKVDVLSSALQYKLQYCGPRVSRTRGVTRPRIKSAQRLARCVLNLLIRSSTDGCLYVLIGLLFALLQREKLDLAFLSCDTSDSILWSPSLQS